LEVLKEIPSCLESVGLYLRCPYVFMTRIMYRDYFAFILHDLLCRSSLLSALFVQISLAITHYNYGRNSGRRHNSRSYRASAVATPVSSRSRCYHQLRLWRGSVPLVPFVPAISPLLAILYTWILLNQEEGY